MADPIVEGRLRRLIGALRREGPLHIAEVLRHHRRRLRWARAEQPLPEVAPFLAPHAERPDGTEGAIDRLAEHARRLLHPWLLDEQTRRETIARFSGEFGEDVFRAADEVASGRFTILGVSIAEPDGRFDWHRDYVSGKVWPLDRFDRIEFLSGDGADVKYPWELSRMTWLGSLGLAHAVDPDRSLPSSGRTPAAAFRHLFDDWTANNPYGRGVNWAMPMEVALRSFWLISALSLFHRPATDDPDWWTNLVALIAGHGRSLDNTLEYLPNLTNHYIADCFGLLVTGALFMESKEGSGWFRDGRRRLERELRRQVTEDGVHYERSLPYHGLVLELFLVAALVAERAGRPFDPESLEIIDRMAHVTAQTIPAPGRSIPLLGDADDGRLLRLLPWSDLYDHAFLPELHDGLRGVDGRRTGIEALLLLGEGTGESEERSRADRSELFAEGGLAVLRNRYALCIADVGPIGLHGNNDTLSFALYGADGTPWIVDPGTGCYTGNPELRNSLRSTRAHNTLMLDDREIAQFAGLWRVREDRTSVEIVEFRNGTGDPGDPVFLRARHHAWESEQTGRVIHEREWVLEGEELRVTDRLTGSGPHRVGVRFTLHQEVSVRQENRTYMLHRGDGQRMELTSSLDLEVEEGFLSLSYGLLLPAKWLQSDRTMNLPIEIEYLCRFPSDLSEPE